MKKAMYVFITLIGILALSACGSSGGSNTAATPEQMYARSCSHCHGADLKSGREPDLDKIGSTYTAEEIKDIIQNGKNRMPPMRLNDEDAMKVAEWLATHK